MHPPGGGDILLLCQQKFSVSGSAVTLIAGDELATICFFGVCHIVDDAGNGLTLGVAFVDVQGHDASDGQEIRLQIKQDGLPPQAVLC